jgi:apolipoprotein N-acyltransferase
VTAQRPLRDASGATLVAAAALGGVLTALAYAPTRWLPLLVAGPALGLWAAARTASARRGALCGLVFGVAFGYVEFRWMFEVDVVPALLLPPVEGLWWALPGAVAGAAARLPIGWWVATTASAWTIAEAARARAPLSGFEWGQLAMAAAPTPLRSVVAVVGALGLTALLAAAAAALAAPALDGRRAWRPLGLVVLLAVALSAVGAHDMTAPAGRLDVAVVQVDDPCPGAFAEDCPGYGEDLLRDYIAGTAALERTPELVLWGEDALPGAETLSDVGDRIAALTGGLPAPLLAGVGTPAAPGRFLRWAALFDRDGTSLGGYAKREPVPFGEYVPLRAVLGGISDVGRLVPSDLQPGVDTSPVIVPTDDGPVPLGATVSWEVIFSRLVRDVAVDAEGLVTLTTVSSYGTSAASDQLLDAAQLRAAEHHKPVVVAATTGRSAVIDPAGARVTTSALFGADTTIGTLELRSGLTPFARTGDLPTVLLAVLILVGGLVLHRRAAGGRREGVEDPAAASRPSDAVTT